MVNKLHFWIHETNGGLRCQQISAVTYGKVCKMAGSIPRYIELPSHDVHFVAHKSIHRVRAKKVLASRLNDMLKAGEIG